MFPVHRNANEFYLHCVGAQLLQSLNETYLCNQRVGKQHQDTET